MDLIEIDVIRAKPRKAAVDLAEDCLAREPASVGIFFMEREEQLRGDDDFVASRELAHRPAQHFLAAAKRVHVRRVEEIDAQLERPAIERSRGGFVEDPGVMSTRRIAVTHTPETQPRYL